MILAKALHTQTWFADGRTNNADINLFVMQRLNLLSSRQFMQSQFYRRKLFSKDP
jgi:hypothetical protein